MQDYDKQAHVKWECKYHVVFVPKYRKKVMFGSTRKEVGKILRKLCHEKGIEILEAHAMPDHIHMCLSIPPKYSVSHVMGYLKGKSSIRIHRELLGKNRNFTGYHFWARGYFVSSVGLNLERVVKYIQNQEVADKKMDQLIMPL
jgi:putative transposase